MRNRAVPLAVLVAALAALAGSVAWAAGRGDDGWTMARYGSGMMGLSARDGQAPVRSLAEAKRQAQRFADRLDLTAGEVMRFTNQFYVELRERDGRPATEVLVDPDSGAVWLEYGPAMMWNTRYGMMSDVRFRSSEDGAGMMGGGGMMDDGGTTGGMMGGMMGGGMMDGSPAAPTAVLRARPVSAAEALRIAQRWLDRGGERLAAAAPVRFPGYTTLHVLRDGEVAGMLSVNGATGAVWFHSWHGRFLSMTA